MAAVPAGLAEALQDRYRLVRELGQGGMATVYLAEDLKHHRQVAVKVLRPDLAATLGPERFVREITIAAGLSHPHILPLHDSGEAGGFLYYVMPFVEGHSLREKLEREGELPVADAVRILRDVADALAYAHQHGVVHRDIKPENVMVSGRHALVTDFGVAKAVSEAAGQQTLTTVGLALGTPTYMAPEQATADPHIDHRADIYALGVLGYELLAGRPPFVGTSAQAVLAAQVTATAEPLTTRRPSVPPRLASLVMRCLEKRAADRWQSIEEILPELEAALTPSGGVPPTAARVAEHSRGIPLTRRRRAVGIGVAALITAAGFLSWHLITTNRGTALDENAIAVAPFDVVGPALGVWREGMVDLLSRNLDGAGRLRTIAPTVVIRRWSGRADPASARELGRATNAGLVVFGGLVPLGGDSVQLRGGLLDTREGRVLDEFQIAGTAGRMVQLGDSVTVVLLQGLGKIRAIGATTYGSLGSRSPPALKEFLVAEQFYRRSEWDSAQNHYQRATALDTTFALGWNRLGKIAGWQSTFQDSLEGVYYMRAGRFNRGLAPRDSLLIVSDSLQAALNARSGAPQSWAWRKRIFSTLEEATRRYPDDPAAWYDLGEARYHYAVGPGLAARASETLDAFDRAILLDSSFAPAYIHCVELSTGLGGRKASERYYQAYLHLDPRDPEGDGIRLAYALSDPMRRGTPEVQKLLDTMSADGLFAAYWPLVRSADTATPVLAVAQAIYHGRPGRSPIWKLDPFRGYLLAEPLVERGRYREAVTTTRSKAPWVVGLATLAGVMAPDSAVPMFRELLRARNLPSIGSSGAPAFWAATGDTASLKTLGSVIDSLSKADTAASQSASLSAFSQSAQAYLALAHRDTAEALRRFVAMSDTLCPDCTWIRLQKARLLAGAGRNREAAAVLDGGLDEYDPPHVWLSLERARIAERLDDHDRAVEEYQLVLSRWFKADPELQPFVEEARRALKRLSTEPQTQN